MTEKADIEKQEKTQKKKNGKKYKKNSGKKSDKLEEQENQTDKKDDKDTSQDYAFNVEIQPPSGSSFEIQVCNLAFKCELIKTNY